MPYDRPRLCHRAVVEAMTFVDEVEVRRASVGTRVLAFACGILAVLGSFWAIVWFIRAYVEAPRVNIPAPMLLASSESRPAPAPAARAGGDPEGRAPLPARRRSSRRRQNPRRRRRAGTCREKSPAASREPAAVRRRAPSPTAGSDEPVGHPAPPGPSAAPGHPGRAARPPGRTGAGRATAADTADTEPPIEEVAEGSVPAIAGRHRCRDASRS